MRILILHLMLAIFIKSANAQQKYWGVAVYNTQPAMPFGVFVPLVTGPVHPGISFSYRNVAKELRKSSWFWEANAAIFYHRFIQVGVPVYVSMGYRYKFTSSFAAEISVGGGYLHAITATGRLEADENGIYHNKKSIGRPQFLIDGGIDISYKLKHKATASSEIFAGYHPMFQLPFIKSYVPLLPYNRLQIGVRMPFKKQE